MVDESKAGEVIEASTTYFTGQCYELYQSPNLGRLVRTKGDANCEIYGVVCNALTTGMEPGRKAIARGKNENNEEEVYRSSPQLYKLLKSEFTVLVVGFQQGDQFFQYLPPRSARIHGFIHLCDSGEVKQFSRSLDFLDLILKSRSDISVEELAGAALREMSQVYGADRRAFLVTAGKELAVLLSNDYLRLKAILKGLKYDATQR